MRPYEAYQRQQNASMPRIDLILALYRKAFDFLSRARQALVENRPDVSKPLLAQTQLIVSSLASSQAGSSDEGAGNFLRLYEFVSHRLALGAIEDIDAAEKVLRPLFDAFASVRDQAAALEAQGQIPPLRRDHEVQLSA